MTVENPESTVPELITSLELVPVITMSPAEGVILAIWNEVANGPLFPTVPATASYTAEVVSVPENA
jgi:hypothetical protein